MKKKILPRATGFVAALLVLVLLAGPAAFADGFVAAKTLGQVINGITGWLVGLLASVATLFLTIGGVRYLMAGGDPGEVGKAKDSLKYAAIGYGVAALAPALVTILKQLTGV